MKTILFVHYGDDWIRGSERCLLDLMTHIDKHQYRPVLWCNSEVLRQAALALGIPVICQPFSLLLAGKAGRFDGMGLYRQIQQGVALVKQYDIDVIHANSGAPCQWLNGVARISHLPLVAHLHSRYPLWQRWVLGLHQVDQVIGVSQPVVAQLRQDGMAEDKMSVIANGIDCQRLSQQPVVDLRQRLNLASCTVLLVAVGSLIARKGMDIAITACAALEQQGMDVHLLIIGEGEARPQLERQISDLALDERVTLMGECADVVGHLKGGCDLVLSTAREEVFGLVALEAALARVAVIAPRVGGIPEVITDRETGLLYQPGNVDELVDHINTLMLAPAMRERLAEASYHRLQTVFSIQANVAGITAVYQRLIAAYQHPPPTRVCAKRRGTSWLNVFRSLFHSQIWKKYWPSGSVAK